MSLWKIAWKSIRQRGLASLLTTLSMALGVMLVVIVLSVHGVVDESFRTNSSLGYNMIVGAKGGRLQLTLNTVYYLSQPIENIPYDYYLEFLPREERDRELAQSIQQRGHEALWESLQANTLLGSGMLPGAPGLAGLAALQALDDTSAQLPSFAAVSTSPQVTLERGRDGRFAQFVDQVIPVCLGDYFGQFRVVGTTPAMLDRVYDLERQARFTFAHGRNFRTWSQEHGFFEAVVGSRVASEMEVKLGDEIAPSHGAPDGSGHETTFRVVGILAPSGTPSDRAVFVNMEGFFLLEDHAGPLAGERPSVRPDWGREAARTTPLPVEQRQVTALLVSTHNPFVAMGMESTINRGQVAQAVLPNREIFALLEMIVRPIQLALLALTFLICIVSGISILVSMYNSMSDRRHEIAVMRALGAGRSTVMTIVLFEAILLALAGGVLGWTFGHTLNWAASPLIEDRTGVSLGFFTLAPPVSVLELFRMSPVEWNVPYLNWTITDRVSTELLLIPVLIVLAVLVGLLPALAAYRTDVARSLGK